MTASNTRATFTHNRETLYTGRVAHTTIHATGRTKREAVKRLRHAFRVAGIVTIPDPFTDLLYVSGSGGVEFPADTSVKRLSRRERQVRNGKRLTLHPNLAE
jgi:hypothetical protein